MTLCAHKVVECLESGRYIRIPDVDAKGVAIVCEGIKNSQKFDFGELDLKVAGYIKDVQGRDTPTFEMETLTEDEKGFWLNGLIPLPYPTVWYEFSLKGHRSGLFVTVDDEQDHWIVTRLDYDSKMNDVMWDGAFITIRRSTCVRDETWLYEVVGGSYTEKLFTRHGMSKALNQTSALPMALYFTLMLNSKTTEKTHVLAPAKLNKKREAKGRPPLYSHHTIVIVPERFKRGADQGGTHRSPRLHWRRSHLRHYPAQIAEGGAVIKAAHTTVIPRMLVGKASLGEVSHEYVFKDKK